MTELGDNKVGDKVDDEGCGMIKALAASCPRLNGLGGNKVDDEGCGMIKALAAICPKLEELGD